MKKCNKHQHAFTLVELIIFSGIMMILLGVLTNIFASLIDLRLEAEATSSIQQNGNFIIDRLTYDIHRATTITTPATLGQQTNTLQLSINGTTYTYSLSNNNLVLNNGTSTNQLNGYDTHVTSFSAQRLGNINGKNTLKLRFTLQSVTQRPAGPETRDFETTVGVR